MNASLSLADKLTNEAIIEASIVQRASKNFKARTAYLPEGGFEKLNGFFNGGTIVTVVSSSRSEYINGLEAAIKSKSSERMELHCEAIIAKAKRVNFRPLKIESLDDIPVIIDVLYGESWLAKHLLIAQDTEIAISASVWSGGDLNLDAIRLFEHRQKKSRLGVEVLIVLVPPRLSKIERAVLKAAPQNLSEIHITGPSVAWSAAGIQAKWQRDEMVVPQQKELVQEQHGALSRENINLIQRFLVPFYDKHVHENTVDQHQVQQADTRQQQQQQQQYHTDGQNHQQQQQQQRQDGQQQQQQQEQHQQAQTQQDQNQHQEQQQAQTDQQQHDNQNQHNAATHQEQQGGLWTRDDLDGGFVIRPIDEQIYESLLSRIDFQSMDATQSVKELLRLRERLLTVGLS